MSTPDLPLFSWSPACTVILFPLTKRIGKVRHTAGILAQKRGDDATLYWKQVVAANRKHLSRIGLDEASIETELRSFHDAVQGEMVRQAYAGGHGSGGAA